MSSELQSPPESSAVSALLSAVDDLWPHDRPAELDGRAGRLRPADLQVVPSVRSPRLLVPVGSRAAAGRALSRFSTSLSRRQIASRRAMSVALRLGASAWMKGGVEVTSSDDSIDTYLADVLGRPVLVGLGVGSARVNQKPVLQVFGTDGSPLAFAKVGVAPVSIEDVRSEAHALEQLSAHRFSHLRVPTIIDASPWRDKFVLVMTTLDSHTRQVPRDPARLPADAMRELAEAFPRPASALDASLWWRRQEDVVAALTDPGTREVLTASMSALGSRYRDSLAHGAWHGDWTPWNMSRGGAEVHLWDWERFETDVPTGMDAMHYASQLTLRQHGEGWSSLDRSINEAAASTDVGDAVVDAYLLAIGCRYARLAETAQGDRIAGARDTVLSLLSRRATGSRGGERR